MFFLLDKLRKSFYNQISFYQKFFGAKFYHDLVNMHCQNLFIVIIIKLVDNINEGLKPYHNNSR